MYIKRDSQFNMKPFFVIERNGGRSLWGGMQLVVRGRVSAVGVSHSPPGHITRSLGTRDDVALSHAQPLRHSWDRTTRHVSAEPPGIPRRALESTRSSVVRDSDGGLENTNYRKDATHNHSVVLAAHVCATTLPVVPKRIQRRWPWL